MAIGLLKAIGTLLSGTKPVSCGSVQIGPWVTIHDDEEATASTAAVLIRPLSETSGNVHAIRVPDGATRVLIRDKRTAATVIVASPVLRVYGVYGEANAEGWFADDGTIQVIRLDRHTVGAGATLTLVQATDIRDTTFQYSAPLIQTDDGTPWMDCKGAQYVFVLVETAANITAGTGVLQAAFLN